MNTAHPCANKCAVMGENESTKAPVGPPCTSTINGTLPRGGLRGKIKHPFDVETFVLPSHRVHGRGFPLGREQVRCIERSRGLPGLRRKVERRRLRPALPKPRARRMPHAALQSAHNGVIEVELFRFAAADAQIPAMKAPLHGLKYGRSYDQGILRPERSAKVGRQIPYRSIARGSRRRDRHTPAGHQA